MASFEEIKKRVKKEYQTDGTTNSTSNSGYKSSDAFNKIKEKVNKSGLSFGDIDQDYINSFFTDASDWLNTAQDDYKKVGYSNASSSYDNRYKTYQDLYEKSNLVRAYINSNKGKLSDDEYNKFITFLDDYKQSSFDILGAFESANKYYSQFETEEDYNNAIAYQKRQEELLSFDLESGKVEIDELKKTVNAQSSERNALQKQISQLKAKQQNYYSQRNITKAKECGQMIASLESRLAQYEDVAAQLAEKNAYYREAENLQTQKNMMDSALNAEDFNEYSQIGASIENPTFSEAQGWLVIANKIFVGGKEIKNKVAFMQDDKNYFSVSSSGNKLADTKLHFMTDDEVKTYNYYLGKGDEESAEAYLKSLDETLTYREANDLFERTDGTALQGLFAFSAGVQQFATGVENLFSDKDYYAPTTSQVLGGMIRQDWVDDAGFVGQVGYDILNTTGNMLPSILVGYIPGVGQIAGAASMGLSAMGNAKAEMINLGYSKDQATAYGVLVGASEAGLQYLLGGISKLGGKVSTGLTEKILTKVDNAFARTAIKLGGSMLFEGIEESLQTILEPWFKSITTGASFESANIDEVLYSGLLGALSAGLLEGVGTVAGEVNTYKTGQTIKNVGAVERLTKLGTTFSADSVAYQIANKVNENTGAYTIGRLFNEVGATLTETNKADIVKSLERKGMTTKDASTIAEWLGKAVEGEYFSKRQIAILENNDVVSKTFADVIVNENSTVNQRAQAYAEAVAMVNNGGSKAMADVNSVLVSESSPQATKDAKVENPSTEEETLFRVEILSHYDGKTRLIEDDSEVNVKEIASVKDGTVSVRLEDGRVVDATEVHFGSKDESLLYETVADMGVSTDVANLIVKGFNHEGGISVEDYLEGVRSSYNFGFVGFSSNELTTSNKTKNLPEDTRMAAYNQGKINAIAKNKNAQTAIKETVAKVKEAQKSVKEGTENNQPSKRTGRVKLHGIEESTLTERQSDQIKAVERIAKVFTKSEFTFFASYKDKNGKRVYKDADGNIKHAPSGKFYADGRIWIDINAGNMGNGLILFTAAHELTHFAKEFSPEQYKLFTDFLMQQYGNMTYNGKKVSADMLVERQITKAKNNGREISYEEAFDEVVADSCERFLIDGNALKKLDALEAKDKALVAKIKSFIRNLVKNLKKWYKGLNPDSLEANLVSRMDKAAYNKLISLWENMLADAGENYQAIQSVTDFATNQLTAESDMSINDFNLKEAKFQERTEYFVEPKQVFSVSTTNGASDSKMLPESKWDSVKNIRNKRFAENGFTPKQIAKMNDFIKKTADAMADARIKYKFIGLDDIYNARIILDPRSGNIVLSAMVKNGDYSVNFDFTKICKKRVSLQEVIETLAREKGKTNEDGSVTEVNLSSENIFHINEVLASFGLETACLCCFVESKRYNMQSLYQEKVVDVWNRLVTQYYPDAEYYNLADEDVLNSKIPEKDWVELEKQYNESRTNKKTKADKGEIKDEDESGVEKKMEEFIKANPKEAKLMRFADLVTEKGRTNLNKLYPSVESLVKSKLGTAAPKSVEAFTPYNAEIDLLEAKSGADLVKYLFSIAGVRSQSFSDFMIAHVFDVLQKTASLSARKMPAHTYTKEIARAMLFGMTGEKHNLSVLFNIDENVDSWNAGLSNKGEYLVADYEAYIQGYSDFIQSIGWKDAVRLQNTEGYSKDCGIIGVGFSYNHMLKMHNDPDVRQVIGYHTSSMPVEVKPLTHLDKAADYTPVQNTLKFSGFAKPNYQIPEGVPSYATPPQDVMKGIKGSKTSKVADSINFDIKETFEKLSKGKTGKARTNAAKETLRMLLEYANENGLILKTSKAKAGHGDFALYEDVQATKNPYLTADHYIEYCIENGWLPEFYEFALNQNYYKDIFDFNVFDRLSYNPETGLHEDSKGRKAYAPQTAVHMLNKDGSLSFPEGFHDIIDHQMNNYDRYRKDVSVKTPAIMQEIRNIKDSKGNPIISTKEKLSDRDSDGNTLTKEQQEYFKDSKVRDKDGNLLVVYHGSPSQFTEFSHKFMNTHGNAHGRGFYFTEYKSLAEGFEKKGGQLLQGYLNISKPASETKVTMTKANLVKLIKATCEEQARLFVEEESYDNIKDALKDTWVSNYVDTYHAYNMESVYRQVAETILDGNENDVDILAELTNAGAGRKATLTLARKVLGYDGIIVERGDGTHEFISFESNQFKNADNKTPTTNPDIRYSDRDYAPIFYSQMGKIVEGMKQDKFAANSVVSMLRGRGVKAEEIRWSGIVTWLENKKSVTKQELLEFIDGSQLQIGEVIRRDASNMDAQVKQLSPKTIVLYVDGEIAETFTQDNFGSWHPEKEPNAVFMDNEDILNRYVKTYFKKATKWSQYKLDGGTNYREIVFTMPNSSYSNRAMRGHWGRDAEGILVHARIQDFVTDKGKMLFIEELQSDWHNEGLQKGYSNKEYEDAVATHDKLYNEYKKMDLAFHKYVRSNDFKTDSEDVRKKKHDWLRGKVDTAQKKYLDAEKVVNSLKEKGAGDVSDAPFKDTYHEYVLKRLLRMAAEQGYDSIGWTIADTQSKRWSYDYEKAYKIEYDQEMPKFLSKYGRQWGAKVDKSKAPNGEEVWSMDLTDSMKNTVLNEGQVLYSDREDFSKEINRWNREGRPDGEDFILGSTGNVLQGLGAIESDIYMVSDKINEILSEHPEMTLDEIKKIPQILENPVLILKSRYIGGGKKQNTRLVIFGTIKAKNGLPILSVLYLRPSEKRLVIDDLQKVTSAYTKSTDPVNFTKESDVLYVEKNKATSLLRTIGFHMPIELHKSGFIGNISYVGQNVNIIGEKFSKIIFDNDSDTKYQDRDSDSMSNRSLLANALESATKNDIERNKLAQYKEKINLIDSEEQKLHKLNQEIHDIRFRKGRTQAETKKMRELEFEAKQTANRINTYDRQLLTLEASKPLKDVIEREKKLAYKRAEQKGKEALAKAKERQAQTTRELMTRYQESRAKGVEGRRKTEMKHKIKKVVGDLNNLLLNPTKDKHIKEELRKAVAEALSVINMDTVGAEERVAKYNELIAKSSDPDMIAELTASRDRIQLQGENLKEKLSALQTAYEKIKNAEDVEIVNAYQEPVLNTIKAVVEEVGDTSIRDMTLKQLESVYDMYKMILHTVRTANKMFKAQKYETLVQTAEAVNEEVRNVGGEHYEHSVVGSALRKAGWSLLKPLTAFRTIGSDTFTGLYNNLRAGEDTYYKDIKEAQDFIKAKYEKYGFKKWDMKETKEFTAKSGKTFKLTLEQIMSLYAYGRREQAIAHIVEGGIVLEDAITTKKVLGLIPIKKEVNTKSAFNISYETFHEITETLTQEQKLFVMEMQDYLSNEMGAKGNEVSMELFGVKLFKEKFYFPLKSSKFYMNFKPEEAGEIKLKNSSFTKETVQHANNPVVLSNFTDVWAEHVNDMAMYHSFVLPLEDFTRVFNYKTKTAENVETMATEATIATAYGKGATQYIRNFLKSLNGGVRTESVDPADKLVSLSKKGAVLASASVTIQQPSAIMRAMALINPIHFVTTTHKSINLVKHKQDWAELKKYAPIAGIKEMGGYDIGMGQGTVDWIKGQNTIKEKVDDALGKAPALMDEITWVSIWNAVKRETASNNKGMDVNSEAFLKKAGERFAEVISQTQVYDSVFSRSDLMRNKSWIAKAITAFMAEPSTTLNMVVDSFIQGKRIGNVGGFLKTTATTGGAVVGAIVFNATLKSIITAMRDDDEDETYIEKYLAAFVGNALDDINPLSYIPLAKDVVSILKGYDVERMDMALFSDLVNAGKAFDSDSKTDYEKWMGLASAISGFFGVPLKNVERDIRGAYNTIKSFIDGEKTTEMGINIAIREGLTGEEISNKQQLYEAIINGDQEHFERVKARYEDADKLKSAIRLVFKEHYLAGDIDSESAVKYLIEYAEMDEDDAYWKMQEWEYELENGDAEDYGKYNDFFDAVTTGKNLKAVIKEYTDNGVEKQTLASQITSHFKPLYKEMSNRERAGIKGYLLNAYALLGYDRTKKSKDIDKWLEDED